MTLSEILTLSLGVLGFLYGVYKHSESNRFQQRQIAREHDKETVKEVQETNKIKSDAELYNLHILQKFKHLDFTGLNAILQKPLLLEKVYAKLRAKQSFGLAHPRSIDDFRKLRQVRSGEEEEEKEKDQGFNNVFAALHHTSAPANGNL